MRTHIPIRKVAACFIFALAGLGAHQAKATVIYSYAAGSSSYSGAVGSTVAVNLYLDETLTNNSTPYISANGGLGGAGAAVNVSGTTSGSPASITNGSFTAAPSFAGGPITTDYNQGTGNNLEFLEAIPTTAATGVMPVNQQVLLGTLNITVGSGTTTYSLTSLNDDTINGSNSNLGQTDGNTVTIDPPPLGSDLDAPSASYSGADLAPAFTFTVSPVPEPACLSMFALALIALRRKRAT